MIGSDSDRFSIVPGGCLESSKSILLCRTPRMRLCRRADLLDKRCEGTARWLHRESGCLLPCLGFWFLCFFASSACFDVFWHWKIGWHTLPGQSGQSFWGHLVGRGARDLFGSVWLSMALTFCCILVVFRCNLVSFFEHSIFRSIWCLSIWDNSYLVSFKVLLRLRGHAQAYSAARVMVLPNLLIHWVCMDCRYFTETKTQVQMHHQGPIAQLPRQVYTQSRQLKDFKLSQLSPYVSSQFSHSTIFPIWQGSAAWRSTWCMTFVDMKLFVILLWFAWHLFVASNAMDSAFPFCGFKSITSQDFRQTTPESGIILFCGFGKKGLLTIRSIIFFGWVHERIIPAGSASFQRNELWLISLPKRTKNQVCKIARGCFFLRGSEILDPELKGANLELECFYDMLASCTLVGQRVRDKGIVHEMPEACRSCVSCFVEPGKVQPLWFIRHPSSVASFQ